MTWLTIASALIQLALQIIRYLQGRQALTTAATAQLKQLESQVAEIAATIKSARKDSDASQPDIVHDPFNLDGSSLPADAQHLGAPPKPNGSGT